MVQLLILDGASNIVFSTPPPLSPGALTGTSNATVVPAYALPPGTNLTAHLTVAQPGLPNTSDYPGATGIAALAKDTEFALRTRPAPPAPILTPLPQSAGQFRLRLTGEPNRTHQIQATAAFDGWTNLFVTNSVTGVFEYTDPASVGLPFRFYRARVGD
jgi:hypothetical protein